ncbi:MAG: hypothetical protein ACOYKA_04230 [Legionellaceae bacterium]
MNKWIVLMALPALNSSPGFAITQPKFSFVPKTSTSIVVPANRHAYVQYKVTNNTAVTRTLTMQPIPHVTQRTEDNTQCANPFTLAPHQSCNLTLYIDGALQETSHAGGPIVCKTYKNTNTPDPFLCSEPESGLVLSIKPAPSVTPSVNKLYVSNWNGNSISLCYINAAGTLEHCLESAISSTFLNPEALAISNNVLFVANIGGGMSSCVIDQTTGELSSCIDAADAQAPIYAPDGVAILSGTAYISDSGPEANHQGVTTCTVSDTNLINCSFTQGDADFSVPSDLAISNNTLYITNFNSQTLQTTYCTLGSPLCTSGPGEGIVAGTSPLLNEPEGLFFATIQGINYAYFTNHGNNTVTFCEAGSATTFSNCTTTQGYFEGFGNLAILDSSLKAFIPSGVNSLNICTVDSSNGALSDCVTSSETSFNSPSGLVFG